MTSTPESITETDLSAATAAKPIIAIVGRPNVGKSTLFNRLIGRRSAIVMDEPGTTRDRVYGDIDWNGSLITIVDTGGLDPLGSGDFVEEVQLQAHQALQEADAILFLVDAKSGVTPVDNDVADLLRRQDRPVLLAVNKVEGRSPEATVPEFYALGLCDPTAISVGQWSKTQDNLLSVVAPAASGSGSDVLCVEIDSDTAGYFDVDATNLTTDFGSNVSNGPLTWSPLDLKGAIIRSTGRKRKALR